MPRTAINPHFVASQGGYSRDQAATVYQRMKSQSAVCVNDWEMARYVLALGGTPILRIRCPDDDDADARFDPIEYVDTAHTELSVAESGIAGAALKGRIHIGNELGSAAPERTAAWLEKAIRRATFHKRKAVAANWSVKNPAPFMHDYLKGVYVAINENGGEIGAHEGAYIDPDTKEVFRTFEECLAGGCIGGYREAARKYGFRVRITEFAASKTPVDGWSTWMSEAEFAKLCDDAAAFYAQSGIEAHVYSAFKWDRGTGFEYANVPTLQDKFAQTNAAYEVKEPQVTQPIPAPTEGGEIATLTKLPGAFVNVRAQPNLASSTTNSSADVGDLVKGDTVKWYPNAKQGEWVHIVPVNAPKALAGWVSLQNGAVVFSAVAPPPSKVYQFTEAQMSELRRLTKQQDDTNAALVALLDEGTLADSSGGF